MDRYSSHSFIHKNLHLFPFYCEDVLLAVNTFLRRAQASKDTRFQWTLSLNTILLLDVIRVPTRTVGHTHLSTPAQGHPGSLHPAWWMSYFFFFFYSIFSTLFAYYSALFYIDQLQAGQGVNAELLLFPVCCKEFSWLSLPPPEYRQIIPFIKMLSYRISWQQYARVISFYCSKF